MSKRDLLVDMGLEEAVCIDGCDDAIIGTTTDDRVVYSYSKMIDCLMANDGMGYEEAAEFIDCNTIRSLPHIENAPVIMYSIEALDG